MEKKTKNRGNSVPVIQHQPSSFRGQESKPDIYGGKHGTTKADPSIDRRNEVGFYVGNRLETFDAETFAIMRAVHFVVAGRQTERNFVIFAGGHAENRFRLKAIEWVLDFRTRHILCHETLRQRLCLASFSSLSLSFSFIVFPIFVRGLCLT